MKENYTHITVILDRTGSMECIRDDTIGGFNAFLERQQQAEGTATMTLVQFDSQDPYEVLYRFRDIADAPKLTRETYVPRASTPLLDAMGRGINDLEASLKALDTADRPEHVLFVVITDGQENASREFSKSDIIKMIDQRKAAGWQFVFLSADLDAIDEAETLGVVAASRLKYRKDESGVMAAFLSLDDKVARMRAKRAMMVEFDEQDRAAQDESDAPDKA
jgi:Mg-chelatase subunit ChlD